MTFRGHAARHAAPASAFRLVPCSCRQLATVSATRSWSVPWSATRMFGMSLLLSIELFLSGLFPSFSLSSPSLISILFFSVSPRDCEVSEWTAYSKCTRKCGGGTLEQRRSVVADPAHGGIGCPALRRIHECNTQPCPDSHCPTTAWQPAAGSRCSKACGGGERQVVRALIEPKPQCKHVQLQKTVRCNRHACPRDCQVHTVSECDEAEILLGFVI